MSTGSGERDRAVFLALITTVVCLWIGKTLIGFFWVVALGAAVFLFTVSYAFFLRLQRSRGQ